MIAPWYGIALVVAVFVGLLVSLRTVQRLYEPHPELVRKIFHVSMGLFLLTLPWIFDRAWPVFALSAGTVALLMAIRFIPALRERFGRILGGVERQSFGELYFALSIALLFYLSDRDPILFCVPLLILTLADAIAALVGVRYGQIRYAAAIEGAKSAEGSLAFLLVTFLSVHIPLLLMTETGRAESLLIALNMGLVVMLFEAIAWRGIDNIFIPLFGFLLLKFYLSMSIRDLVARFVVIVLLAGLVHLYRNRTTLDETGLLSAVLVGYICWALGGWPWIVAPMLIFLTYTLLSPRTEDNSQRIHNVHAVLSVSGAGLVWLFLMRSFDRPELYLPFTLAFSAHLAIAGVARLSYDYPNMPTPVLLTTCIAKAWIVFFLPYLLIVGFSIETFVASAICLAGIALAAITFYATQPGIDNCPSDGPRWWRQASAAAIGSVVALVPVYVLT